VILADVFLSSRGQGALAGGILHQVEWIELKAREGHPGSLKNGVLVYFIRSAGEGAVTKKVVLIK
jgi:hypothetical protein